MKTKFAVLLFLLLILTSFSSLSFAQTELPNTQLLLMHEDNVIPYMSSKYESALKDFVKMVSDAKIERMYNVIQTDIFKYTVIIQVTDFDGLAKYFGMSDEVVNKIGKDKFEKQMAKFDGCYDSHRNYLMILRNDLSYKPEYGLNPDEGLNYRHLDYFYVVPGKEDEMLELIKEYKKLYEAKNIEEGFRVYTGSVGTELGLFLFVQPAKNRIDFATLSDKQEKILGEEEQKLFEKAVSITQKFEHHDGQMRPDLSYRKK
ncbi:MAG: hypothetical protein HXY50_01315 [Ignavibacteriaceae bacterium]|nr:hypothetical protein [Ignavibacteriaceae bacterium]